MDCAKSKIARLVSDYTKSGKYADEYFADQVISILVNSLKVNDFVLNRKFSLDQKLLGGYDCFSRTIYIDMNKLFKHINSKLSQEFVNGIRSDSQDLLLKYNLAFVNTIAHEVYHALQYKTAFKNKDTLETELLKLSFEHNLMVFTSEITRDYLTANEVEYVVLLGNMENNTVYLDALPSERMACINASAVENGVAKIVTKEQNIRDYMDVKYQMERIRGYLNGNCPTAYIMSVHNKLRNAYGIGSNLPEKLHENEVTCIELAKQLDLSLDDRFYYGLYVTGDELQPKIESINTLTRKITNKS